mgnify:CR=1 FL=1
MTETSVSDETAPSLAPPGIIDRLRPRLKLAGGILASLGAVGAVVGGLAGYLNAWKTIEGAFRDGKTSGGTVKPAASVSKGPTVAVLPFANETGEAAQDAFAVGLARETIAALDKFSVLRVLAFAATAAYAGKRAEPGDVARQAGADYVVDGDLRKNGVGLRISYRLIDARTGVQVWSRVFDAAAEAGNSAAAQVEIAGRASAFLGSFYSGVAAAEYKRILATPIDQLSPYDCIVQGIAITSPQNYIRARTCLETLVVREPSNATAFSVLSNVYAHQRWFGHGLPAEEAASVDKRAYLIPKVIENASRAVELAPADAFAHKALAQAYWTSCQRDRIFIESQQAMELNPNDPQLVGAAGIYRSFTGDWDGGAPLVQKAMAMVAPAPGSRLWGWVIARRHWARGEYEQAYAAFLKFYIEQDWISHLDMAYALPSVGRIEEAKAEVATLQRMRPGFTIRDADAYYRMWCLDASYREKMTGALRKAGLPE